MISFPQKITKTSNCRAIFRRHLHSSKIKQNPPPSCSSVNYFNDDQALHFIISSKDSSLNDRSSSSSNMPKIYSPALNFEPTSMKKMELHRNTSSDTIQSVHDIIESHYTLDDTTKDQFVGGMGENDGGVWFVNNDDNDDEEDKDTLDYWQEIRQIIQTVKTSRHGINFGIYSSGIVQNKEIISNLKEYVGISSIQVTLGSGDPQSYSQVVGRRKDMDSNAAFGRVCNFIVESAESGFPVIAAVAGGKHAGPGSELAKALGAIDVVVYKDIV